MKTLRFGDSGYQVILLQKLLAKSNGNSYPSANFDVITLKAVKDFQMSRGLISDGIVGNQTWKKLLEESDNFNLDTSNYFLKEAEYIKQIFPKKTIYLHHTAGRYRPDYTIQGWNADSTIKLNRVGTAFVIGGKGFDGDLRFDGKTYRAFNEIYWAHHLGLKRIHNNTSQEQNVKLNAESIAIEICSLGALIKNPDGTFKAAAYPDKMILVPESKVYDLERPWRGFQYFQKYTDRQIAECKRLILTLAFLFDIPLQQIIYNSNWFEVNDKAFLGERGLWTHANVRYEKTDCFPQPGFIKMLNSLYEDQKTFTIRAESLESIHVDLTTPQKKVEAVEEFEGYSSDLDDINS